MLETRINEFKALRTEVEALRTETVELQNTRLPELKERALAAGFSVQFANNTLGQTYNDTDFAAAKQELESKKGEQLDAELMIKNAETRLRTIKSIIMPPKVAALVSAERAMWQAKYDEIFATLPDLPEETMAIVEKLACILLNIDSHKHAQGISYGKPSSDKQGKPSAQAISDAGTILRTEMDI